MYNEFLFFYKKSLINNLSQIAFYVNIQMF